MLQFRACVCVRVCVLVRVHDLDGLADRVHRQGRHSFGEDSRGSGFVSVLSPGTNTKGSVEQQKCHDALGVFLDIRILLRRAHLT